jgi:hypothetical protein
VWAVGDGAAGTPAAAAVGARIAADRPDRVLYLGDVYDADSAAAFRSRMGDAYAPVLRRMLPTPGNHEWPGRRVGYDAFWQRVTGGRMPPWYAVRIGGWQVLSLNSEAPHGARSAQMRWLRRELGVRAPCRLAFWHRPRFSAGTHGDQVDVGPLWDAVVGRVALVLDGHDHDMQRLRPIDGTTEVVSGAGGNGHYPVDTADRRLAFADDTRDGALRLVLRRHRAALSFVGVDGRVLDHASVRCTA